MKLSIIVATNLDNVIGKDNKLPWHLPSDLAWFKKHTTGKYIIMGRKTFESIGKPLPNRTSIVITNHKKYNPNSSSVVVVHSIEEALDYAKGDPSGEPIVIGGEQIYKQMLPKADRLYRTIVETPIIKGDAFFPGIDRRDWKLVHGEFYRKDDINKYDHSFEIFNRKFK